MSEPVPTLNPAATDAPQKAATEAVRNPIYAEAKAAEGAPRGAANLYGCASIEKFCDAGSLSYTHDDAAGFYNYVKQFNAPNFWYQDAGVAVWMYYEPYDHWQDTYGADAVRSFYHSGHGGMGSDGTFYAPMGSNWGGLGCTAVSNKMELGDEQLRYLFWSTCTSLRVLDGHSPIKTWNKVNKGMRMIFGFETVSYDNPNYGKFFFEEWNKNKSFSLAWLDASWRIAHNQAPSVCACGASQQEAQDRLYNERLFNGGKASTAWWWWRWYNAALSRDLMTSVPAQLQIATLAPATLDRGDLLDRFELGSRASSRAGYGDRSVSVGADGSFAVELGEPDLDNERAPSMASARAAADGLIARLALASGSDLVLDRVILDQSAGASARGSGDVAAPRTTATIVQYRQTIDGIPIISPDAGTLRVAVDNSGNPIRVEGSLREVADVSDGGGRTAPRQPEPGGRATVAPEDEESPEPQAPHETALADAAGDQLRTLIARGASPVGVTIVPGTTEIGYAVRDNVAELVATRSIEVDFGHGYRKLYRVEVPVSG